MGATSTTDSETGCDKKVIDDALKPPVISNSKSTSNDSESDAKKTKKELENNQLNIFSSQIIKDRKSKFQCHYAKTENMDDYIYFMDWIKNQENFESAEHKIVCSRMIIPGCETPIKLDDGEKGAAEFLYNEVVLAHNLVDITFVATRWYDNVIGHIRLGRDRFTHLKNVAMEALQQDHSNFVNVFQRVKHQNKVASPSHARTQPNAYINKSYSRDIWLIGESTINTIDKRNIGKNSNNCSKSNTGTIQDANDLVKQSKFERKHVVLSVGTNDLKQNNVETCIDNLETLIENVKEKRKGGTPPHMFSVAF